MKRNLMTENAMEIADVICTEGAKVKDCQAASYIGIDSSTFCRFKTEHLDKFCAYLDFLGLKVVAKEMKTISDEELTALRFFAKKGVDGK